MTSVRTEGTMKHPDNLNRRIMARELFSLSLYIFFLISWLIGYYSLALCDLINLIFCLHKKILCYITRDATLTHAK